MKNFVYTLLYIHTDKPEYSEILGVFRNKDTAVKHLLERANYREINNKLTQYMKFTNEYPSYDYLYRKVYNTNELYDVDIYRIEEELVQ